MIYTTRESAIKAKTDLIGTSAAAVASTDTTKSITASVGSTETINITCNQSVDALTLAASVETKDGTVVASVVDGSFTTKSGTTASFALTSAMTSAERILRILVTNASTGEQIASPILSIEYDT